MEKYTINCKETNSLNKIYQYQGKSSLRWENSYTTYGHEKDVELEVTIGINDDEYGWFEMWDIETGGEKWYAEGGLWFDDKLVTDYDGIFELPDFIIDGLKQIGYDTSEVE